MGMLGSALGRGLAGAGAGLADVGNKYLDQNLALQRAQAIADIQRTSAVQQAKDIDQYQNDPTRRASLRDLAAADEESIGGARNRVSLAGKKAEAGDAELLAADVNRTKTLGKAQADTATQAEIDRGTNPLYIKAKRAEAQATHIESAGSLAQAALANFQIGVARQTQDLRNKLADAVRSGDEKEEAALRAQLDALNDKGGKKDRFYAVAEKAGAAISTALKSANDPNATEDTKREAMATVRQQRAIMEKAAKDAGVDISDAAKVPEADMHKQADAAIKAGASAEAVNRRLIEQGYQPLPGAKVGTNAPAGSLATSPTGRAAAPAEAPPAAPPGSPQAAHDAAQAKARADIAARQQAKEQSKAAARAAFDADAASLQPADLVAKYQDMGARGALSLAQLSRLKQAEAQMLTR